MIPEERLEQISQRFQYLEAAMADGSGDIVEMAREYSELKPVVEQITLWRGLREDLEEAEALLDDPDMKALAEEELPILRAKLPKLEKALQVALLPKDAADARPAMLEIRPGTGGDEAALFAADLLRMYQRYAEARGWRFEIIEEAPPGSSANPSAVISRRQVSSVRLAACCASASISWITGSPRDTVPNSSPAVNSAGAPSSPSRLEPSIAPKGA